MCVWEYEKPFVVRVTCSVCVMSVFECVGVCKEECKGGVGGVCKLIVIVYPVCGSVCEGFRGPVTQSNQVSSGCGLR